MDKRFIRVWTELDTEEIAKHLIIIGDLHAQCSNCSEIGLNVALSHCPKCKTEFKYATFLSEKDRGSQIVKMRGPLKGRTFIDHSDFKKSQAESKVKDFFK